MGDSTTSGTIIGGRRAAATNKLNDPDFYRRIGRRGGANGKGLGYTGGFAAGGEGRERARIYGAVGGRISRKVKKEI